MPLLKRAIEIDPKFAMALCVAGASSTALIGRVRRSSAEQQQEAYELRDRVSDREKFFITATYELPGDGKPGKGATDLRVVGCRPILAT